MLYLIIALLSEFDSLSVATRLGENRYSQIGINSGFDRETVGGLENITQDAGWSVLYNNSIEAIITFF